MNRNGRVQRNLSPEKCAVVVVFSEEVESQQSIARRLGVTHSIISRVQNRFRETDANARRLDQGRKRSSRQIFAPTNFERMICNKL
jgi:transposase